MTFREQDIKDKTLALGFDLVGITSAQALNPIAQQYFHQWLDHTYNAGMFYLRNHLEKRLCPAKLLAGAKSVIVVGLNYKSPISYTQSSLAEGYIAEYARYEDYHCFLKQRLYTLADDILAPCGTDITYKVCVDSAPLAERSLAVRAGLGFIGKNHMLIHPDLGPTLFLGEIVTSLELNEDRAVKQDCGTCDLCIKACPTGALRNDGFFDASRCINYLTIEHKGDIPRELASRIGNCLYGCDVCIHTCPYYKTAPVCKNKDLTYYPNRTRINLSEILTWNAIKFTEALVDSPIQRIGLQRFQRNARICLNNR